MKKIVSVIRKVVIVINGVEHVVDKTDWTTYIKQAQEENEFKNKKDIINWIEGVW